MSDPYEVGQAIGLGLLQGATEFLPVSSSGHLAGFALLTGMSDLSLDDVLLLHAATLLATLLVFGRDLARLATHTLQGCATPARFFETEDGKLARNLVLASVPTAAIGLSLRDSLEALVHTPWVLGLCFMVTAAMLLTTRRATGTGDSLSARQALLVGVAQGLAVLPGVSRSGTTIAFAMALGLSGAAAFRFSFLLSVPVILGATVLEFAHPGAIATLSTGTWFAALVALVSGYAALLWLRRLVTGGRMWMFSLYLLPLGATLILFELFGRSGT